MPKVDATYVKNLYEELRQEQEGLQIRIKEIEEIRYLEDKIQLGSEEKVSGIEVRAGLTGELIENVKAALTSNVPRVVFEPLRTGDKAKDNSSDRELFWTQFIREMNYPVPVSSELADAQGGMGIGILKMAYYPWPKKERRRRPGESDKDYKERQQALKRKWGPPFKAITVHPLSFFFRLGDGNMIAEVVEHSYKPRRAMYAAYGVETDQQLRAMPDNLSIKSDGPPAAGVPGQPTENVRALPYGSNTTTMVLTTEYWSPDVYQVYLEGRLVYEESPPTVKYFIALGRTTSSKDPDKLAQSVAELLRHNEPAINRMLTRMAEATELLVRKRLTLELPEGSVPEMEMLGESNEPQPKTYRFQPDKAEALPAGSKVVDPYDGVENVYQAMPMLQLMLQLTSQHGVSPIFKGVPPGAVGSGYRDNSLYLMARSQFQYILDSFSACIEGMIEWGEELIEREVRQEVWCGEYSLTPKAIKDFPCKLTVFVDPALPQNIIAEGMFWDRMHARGHIPRRLLLEEGLRKGQPELITRERMLEDLKDQLIPVLYNDVLQTVGILPPTPAPTGQPAGQGIVGPNGQPLTQGQNGNSGTQQMMAMDPAARQAILQSNQSAGGMTRAGAPREPGAGQHPGEMGF